MGERHDLAREPHGWDAPGFDDAAWHPVRSRDLDRRVLVADPGPPIRVTQEIAPVSVTGDGAGRYIVDFGQNLPGWLRIAVDGPAGACVRIRHAEVLDSGGRLYTENLRTARQTDEFVTSGGPEVLEPRFTLHGFRYAEISGYPGQPGPGDIVARVVHSDIPATGSFESSADWLGQLLRAIDWGQRGNFISVPTDCPQRDERLGWLGDAQIFARTACYNRDVAAFFCKWLDDVADAQPPSGAFPDIAPRLSIPWCRVSRLGRRGRDRAVDAVHHVRRHRDPAPAFQRHDRAGWICSSGRTPTTCAPAISATATTTGSRPATTRPRVSCWPPPTGRTTPR